MNREKSITRSKKTTIRLIDAIAEVGLSSVPGGTAFYKFGKILLQHATTFYHDRREERLSEFHERLFENVTEDEKQKLLNSQFSIEDYYSILNQLIQDEEDRKIETYAKIFKAILLNQIPAVYKLHIIKSIRELKYSDFDLMRRIYINEKYEFTAPGNKTKQIASLTQPTNPVQLHSIQTLKRYGYLQDKQGYNPPWPTELNKFIVELLYGAEQLTDKAL